MPNPPDAIMVNGDAVMRSGDALLTTQDNPPCCCGPTGCPYYWKAVRCAVPGCVRTEEIYVCSSAVTALQDGSQPRTVQANDVVLDMAHCWQVLGDAGGQYVPCLPGMPPPAGKRCLPTGAVLLDGTAANPITRIPGGCADPVCGRCYIRARQCDGQTVPGPLCVVVTAQALADWFAQGHSCFVLAIPTPGYNGGSTCFFVDRSDTGSDDPGTCQVWDTHALFRSCCQCMAHRFEEGHQVNDCIYTDDQFLPRRTTSIYTGGEDCEHASTITYGRLQDCCCGPGATRTYDMTFRQFYTPTGVEQFTGTVLGVQRRERNPLGSLVTQTFITRDSTTGAVISTEVIQIRQPMTSCVAWPPFFGGDVISGPGSPTSCFVGVEEYDCSHYLLSGTDQCFLPAGGGQCDPNTLRATFAYRITVDAGQTPGFGCVPCASDGRPIPGGGGFPGPGPGGGFSPGIGRFL